MPEYTYKAKKGPKDTVEGSVFAGSREEAVHLIETKGLLPIEVSLKPAVMAQKTVVSAAEKAQKPQGAKLSTYEVCILTRQLAGFLKTGVPLLNGLDLLKDQSTRPKLRAFLTQASQAVHGGSRFSDALERFGGGSFDSRYLGMVRSGEAGGSLDNILEVLADFLEKEEEIQGQVRSAVAYPLFVLAVSMGTIFFLLTFCLPKLVSLFRRSEHGLPLPTQVLVALAQPASQLIIWVGSVTAVILITVLFFGGAAQKKRRDRFLMRLPFLGAIRIKADIMRFCATLAMLIENGIPLYQAIETTRPVLSNEYLKEDLARAQDRVLGGEMFTAILKESKHFPPFVWQMIAVGEEGGRMVEALREVSRFYARESLRGIKVMTSLIEPTLILGMGLVVGFIVSGIMLPIFDMSWVK